MTRLAYRSVVCAVLLSLLASACASRKTLPIGAGGRPFRPDPDEQALWAQAEQEEDALVKRVAVYDEPMLEEYLANIGDKLVPNNVRAAGGLGFKFVVIRDPTLNAFAMPNGRIYLHTGLLARVENDAQLATILGREIAHVVDRHALTFKRDPANKQTLETMFGVAASLGVAAAAGALAQQGDQAGTAVLSQTANAVLGLRLELAATASISGYGPDLEREADAGGLANLVRAGYDLKEAPKIFALLLKDSADRGPMETFFFGNPLRLQQRIVNTKELLKTRYAATAADTVKGTEDFELRMRTLVRDNALLDVRAGRVALARTQLERVLATTPRDPTAHLYYGDLHRLQSQRAKSLADRQSEAQQAMMSYARAAELDPAFPDPFRQLGFLYYQQKDTAKAREAFERYLALKPDAPDAQRIKEYLIELNR